MRYTKFFCFLFMMVFAASAFSKQPKDKKSMGYIWPVFLLRLRTRWCISLMCSSWTAQPWMTRTCWWDVLYTVSS